MANARFAHSTNAGKIVYKRKTHLMSLSDAKRIVRFVLRNHRENQNAERIFVELRDESDALVMTIMEEIGRYFGVDVHGLSGLFAQYVVFAVGSTGISPVKPNFGDRDPDEDNNKGEGTNAE